MLAFSFLVYRFFSPFFLAPCAVVSHPRIVPQQDLMYYTVRHIHLLCIYAHIECCCHSCCSVRCCAGVVAAVSCNCWLLLIIMCLMAKFVPGSLNLIPVVSFSSTTILRTNRLAVHMCGLEFLRYILRKYGHARRQGGRQPAAAKPPL